MNQIIRTAIALSLAIALAAAWWWLGPAGGGQLSGFLRTADQQAQRLLRAGKPEDAAKRFRDPQWQATALYRAGDFKQAEGVYKGLSGVDAAYNQANSLVMMGKYDQAAKIYDGVIAQRPAWQAAITNRDIARHRAEMLEKKGGDMTGGQMGADAIELDAPKSDDTDQKEQVAGKKMSEADIRALWLRRVQTSPADFLRAKFAYQDAMAQEKPGAEKKK